MRWISRTAMVWTVVAGVLLAGGAVRAQSAAPAQIDRTTPHTQKGLTLLAVTRGDAQGQYTFPVPPELDFLSGPRGSGPAGGIGLWVRGPKSPPTLMQGGRFRAGYSGQNPTASARALNGDSLPAQAGTVYSAPSEPSGGPTAPLFLVTLPGGYPVGYPAIDVSVSDERGHLALWRLIRLAAPFHAVAPPVAVRGTFAGAGARLSVRAWRDNPAGFPVRAGLGFSPDPSMAGVRYEVTAHTPAGSRWLVRIFKRQLEWEAVRPGEREALAARYGPRYAQQVRRQALWTASFGPGVPTYPMQDTVRTPYGKYNRFLRLSGELVQMAEEEEKVTFHDLAVRRSPPPPNPFARMRGPNAYTPPPSYEISTHPQTVVTPSGISISLLPLSALGAGYPRFGGYGTPDRVRMLLRFRQAPPSPYSFQQHPLVLPKSPLYRKYHKPITYSLQAPRPYFLEPSFEGFSPGGPGTPAQMVAALRVPFSPPVRTVRNGQVLFRQAPAVVPGHLDHLTLSVLQSAELRSLPISFVVPIGDQAPVHAPPPIRRSPRRPAPG